MKPLEGVRIISIEVFGAGPYGSMMLANLGAEVIKIENPATGGDPSRYVGPQRLGDADSQYFQSWNLNKKSVVLDLKSKEGRRDLERLVKSASAVMNNLRGDQPTKLGLDYETLGKINPKIVCLHISAYGRDNERAAWPGYDYLMQAEAGLMSLTGEPSGPPSRFGASIVDYMTGITGMVGMLSALLGAERTGKGCDVDVSLFDVALHQLGYAGTWRLNGEYSATRLARSSHFSISPVQTLPTAYGWVFIMCMTQKFWLALLDVIGRRDLADDPRFADPNIRHDNRDALTELLDAEFRKHPTDYWLSKLTGVLPIAPVYDLDQALANPYVDQTGMVWTVPHPEKQDLKVLANPIKINGERGSAQMCSPLGEDNEPLLSTKTEAAE